MSFGDMTIKTNLAMEFYTQTQIGEVMLEIVNQRLGVSGVWENIVLKRGAPLKGRTP